MGLVVECLTREKGLRIEASREALHRVLEQDNLYILCLELVQIWKVRALMTKKMLPGM